MTDCRSLSIRLMRPEDASDGTRFCRMAGWNQIDRDWQFFLDHGADDCFVAQLDGIVVGTAVVTRYAHHLAWIGMVLVDRQFRRQGIGTRLLNHALQHIDDLFTIALDATPAGREVYLTLGFQDVSSVVRLAGDLRAIPTNSGNAQPMAPTELAEVCGWDAEMLGIDRAAILNWWFDGAPAYAWTVRSGQQLQGYCLGREGHSFEQLGPVVAVDLTTGQQLVQALFHAVHQRKWIIDVPTEQVEWIEWLKRLGFSPQRMLYRMVRGRRDALPPTRPQFAIIAPEVG